MVIGLFFSTLSHKANKKFLSITFKDKSEIVIVSYIRSVTTTRNLEMHLMLCDIRGTSPPSHQTLTSIGLEQAKKFLKESLNTALRT